LERLDMSTPAARQTDVLSTPRRALPASERIPAEQETDVWYGGYATRTMLPSFAICYLLTLGIVAFEYVYWEAIPPNQSSLALLAAGGALAALWAFQIIRWLYRVVALHGRLTTRRLFFHRGFLYPDWQAIPLAQVARVEVRANPIERLLGVGSVWLIGEGPSAPPLVLTGVSKPARLAELLRQHLRNQESGVRSEESGSGVRGQIPDS
jgi:membrane protein YdbS with pleckstrin-like domain